MSTITNSRDGVFRMTLRVEHRVGRDDLIRMLCLRASREPDWREDLPERPSKAWIIRESKAILQMDGSATADYWADDVVDGDQDEIEGWATLAVDSAYPEFGGPR